MTAPTPPPASSGSDWPAQATDAIVNVIDLVRDKTSGPAISVVRGLVYGTLFAIVGSAALVLVLVLALRGIDVGVAALLELADLERAGRSTWIAHAVMGLLMLIPGVMLWRKGSRQAAAASS